MKIRLAAILVLLFHTLNADVRFFPRVIYVDANEQSSVIYLQNPSQSDKKYKLYFGYTDQDESGKFIHKKKSELTDSDRYGCDWLKVFPKRIDLKANDKQSIRVSVKVPTDVPEGEYYCRLYAKSQPMPRELDTNNPDVKAMISTIMIIGAPIHIKKGNPELNISASINIESITSDKIALNIDLKNSSLIGIRGNLIVAVVDSDGEPVIQKEIKVTVQTSKRKIMQEIDISSLPAGKQKLYYYLSDSQDVKKGFELIGDEQKRIGEIVFEKP